MSIIINITDLPKGCFVSDTYEAHNNTDSTPEGIVGRIYFVMIHQFKNKSSKCLGGANIHPAMTFNDVYMSLLHHIYTTNNPFDLKINIKSNGMLGRANIELSKQLAPLFEKFMQDQYMVLVLHDPTIDAPFMWINWNNSEEKKVILRYSPKNPSTHIIKDFKLMLLDMSCCK